MNNLKSRLIAGESAVGLWQALANSYTAEICAGAGFDWLMFDCEHAPNTIPLLLAQLQAVAPYPVTAAARLPIGDPVLVKQYLDIGVQNLLIPMVDGPDAAAAMVAATRYPPRGVRGVASSLSRASKFGVDTDYLAKAEQDICLFVQIESRVALDNVERIVEVEGVDGAFVGPSDLAASLGHLGNPAHPEVQNAIDRALDVILDAGKIPGTFAMNPEDCRKRMAEGFRFVSVGSDIGVLVNGIRQLRDAVGP